MDKGEWVFKGEVGTSSKTIWGVMMGLITGHKQCGFDYDIPHDPSDFWRCFKLLTLFPEWKLRLPEVGGIFPKWQPYIKAWDKMEQLFLEEYPTGSCPKLYNFMQNTLYPEAMILDGWVKTGTNGWERDNQEVTHD